MIESVDHIAIAVRDMDESLSYYTEQLGLPIVQDEYLPSAGVRLVYLQAGHSMLQLVQPIGETPIRKFIEERGEGLHHICFGVHDIPQAIGQLAGEENTRVVKGGRDRRACFLAAKPDGVTIEFTEIEPFRMG